MGVASSCSSAPVAADEDKRETGRELLFNAVIREVLTPSKKNCKSLKRKVIEHGICF